MSTALIIERPIGRFVISYDGKELFIYDTKDNQKVIFSSELNRDDLEIMTVGINDTMKLFNKAQRGINE